MSTLYGVRGRMPATFQLFFPHSLRVFLKNVKCCFCFLFDKMSKLRGVENAHTWRHMVRLTRRSTSKLCLISVHRRMQNSAGVRRLRCATRTTSAQVSGESVLHLAARLRDFGVRTRAEFREKTRECVANFV